MQKKIFQTTWRCTFTYTGALQGDSIIKLVQATHQNISFTSPTLSIPVFASTSRKPVLSTVPHVPLQTDRNTVSASDRKTHPAAANDTVKVLFLTYSRSGSSFLGEIINKNKQGFYHFEPLAGVYSALYGLGNNEKSMSVFRYKNFTDR